MDNKQNTWRSIILDFFETSVAKSSLYKSNTYIQEKRSQLNGLSEPKQVQKLETAIAQREAQLAQERTEAPKTEINDWIDDTASKKIANTKRIIKVTHTGKFTHSSASNDGLNVTHNNSLTKPYLSSESMSDLSYDLAHNNGALITISRFLALSKDNKMIIDCILDNDFDFLEGFYLNNGQLEQWKLGLSEIVEARSITSCDKLKALYFPVDYTYADYHLLCPLYATSLAHQIFTDFTQAKYTKREDTYIESNKERVSFIDIAYINYGGEHAKNVSMLNANRGGKGYLFSCKPPVWTSQNNEFTKQRTIFDRGIIRYRAYESLQFLADFVARFQKIELSVAKDDRKKWIIEWINDILQVMTNYADEIIFSNDAGWTIDIDNKFKQTYRLWLDPYYQNIEFQNTRNQTQWQNTISQDFAKWLAKVIAVIAENNQKHISHDDWYESLFITLAKDALRRHEKQIDMLRFEATKEESV